MTVPLVSVHLPKVPSRKDAIKNPIEREDDSVRIVTTMLFPLLISASISVSRSSIVNERIPSSLR
jgi:hypothetical protein